MFERREDPDRVYFMGAMAHGKEKLIRRPPHEIKKSSSSFALSAHNGLWGIHFSVANHLFTKMGKSSD